MIVEILEIVGMLMFLFGYDHIIAISVSEVVVSMFYSHHLFPFEEYWRWQTIHILWHHTTVSIIEIHSHRGLLVVIFTHDALNLLL